MGLGTLWGVRTRDRDVRKAFQFMQKPQIPPEAWKIYQLGKDGGENTVGADSISMQGNVNTPGRAPCAPRGREPGRSKADDNIADPVAHLEYTIKRWRAFQRERILEICHPGDPRILARGWSAILDEITAEAFMDAEFEIKVLCGQKLAAKAAIMQLIPFFLQIVPAAAVDAVAARDWADDQLQAIENAFQRMSELQNWQDIFVPMTDEQKQNMAQMNPRRSRPDGPGGGQAKGQNKLQQIQEQGKQDISTTLVDKAMDHVSWRTCPWNWRRRAGAQTRDMGELQNGVQGVASEDPQKQLVG